MRDQHSLGWVRLLTLALEGLTGHKQHEVVPPEALCQDRRAGGLGHSSAAYYDGSERLPKTVDGTQGRAGFPNNGTKP